MNQLEYGENVAINLAIFKLLRLHYIFNPNYKSVLNLNLYRLTIFVIMLITLMILLLVIFTIITGKSDFVDECEILNLIIILSYYVKYILVIIKIIYKRNDIWNLIDVTRINFLTSHQCHKYIHILHKYCEKSKNITNFIMYLNFIVFISWTIYPIIFNAVDEGDISRRKENVLNFSFPLPVYVYNMYYYTFYVIETLIMFIVFYFYISFNFYLISFGYVFIAQYEIIALAFKTLIDEG